MTEGILRFTRNDEQLTVKPVEPLKEFEKKILRESAALLIKAEKMKIVQGTGILYDAEKEVMCAMGAIAFLKGVSKRTLSGKGSLEPPSFKKTFDGFKTKFSGLYSNESDIQGLIYKINDTYDSHSKPKFSFSKIAEFLNTLAGSATVGKKVKKLVKKVK